MTGHVGVYTYLLPPVMQIGLQTMLQSIDNFEFVQALTTLDDVRTTLARPSTDDKELLITDFVDEFDAHPRLLAELRSNNKLLGVLFFLSPASDATLMKALRVGGDGYLLQSADPALILTALESVADNRGFLEPGITPMILTELRKPMHEMTDVDVDVDLTQRERLLLQLAADGLNNVKIAQILGINEKTVRHYWSMLFRKIGLTDRTQAVLWGIRTGKAELRKFDVIYEN